MYKKTKNKVIIKSMKHRKAFNFYRSYYDVVLELPDEEKLKFLMALLDKQFNNIEPQLTGIAKFAYISQKHSIDAQVDGYMHKVKGKKAPIEPPSIPPTEGPSIDPIEPPYQEGQGQGQGQGQEKEQEKVKVKEDQSLVKEIDFDYLFNTIKNHKI